MPVILAYLLHLLTATALVLLFFVIYTRVTPFDEVALIRGGVPAHDPAVRRGVEFLLSYYPILDRVPRGRATTGC